MTAADPGPLYETLARWQRWRRRRAAPGEGLELRKRLRGRGAGCEDGPSDGAAGLDQWLRELAGARARGRVLDLGCGFGVSLLRWLEAGASTGVGLSASRVQIHEARAEAARRGMAARAEFRVGEFAAMPPGPFDVVLAIEALAHAHDLGAVLRAVHDALAPGGVLLWVDDVLRDDRTDADTAADAEALARYWCSPPLRTAAAAAANVRTAGLRLLQDVDLTPRVPTATASALARRGRWLHLVRTLVPLPSLRRLTAAFLGGVVLERLYGRGRASYRVFLAERPAERP